MKVERWEDESDEDWAERLADEIKDANNIETTQYFIQHDPYDEESFIINYNSKDSWSWKEHPEGPFTCKQVLEWKKKAERWDRLLPHMKVIAENADPLINMILQKEES